MSIEILLTGSFGVGKSSIFNRFIHDDFSDKYYGTMGVRVNEKKLEGHDITLKLWDIAGELKQQKVPKIYFAKKTVILYIIDMTRPFTFKNVPQDIQYLKENANECIIKIIGNKKDLLSESMLEYVQKNELPVTLDWITSAKTGENVFSLFNEIGEMLIESNKNN